jgi:dethiobiotin synthetase
VATLVVTGTGTGVGKTVVTAAVAALAVRRGGAVTVVKAAQTGVGTGETGDLDEIGRLTGITDLREYARYPDPLSPVAAARRSGLAPIDLTHVAGRVLERAADGGLVLIEGAGGLLVEYDEYGATIADLATMVDAAALVVAEATLGTLNATALTLEALARRDIPLAGVVIGAWPEWPDLACRSNIGDLEALAGGPLAGAIPSGAGGADPTAFQDLARDSLGPELGGRFDATMFRKQHRP